MSWGLSRDNRSYNQVSAHSEQRLTDTLLRNIVKIAESIRLIPCDTLAIGVALAGFPAQICPVEFRKGFRKTHNIFLVQGAARSVIEAAYLTAHLSVEESPLRICNAEKSECRAGDE